MSNQSGLHEEGLILICSFRGYSHFIMEGGAFAAGRIAPLTGKQREVNAGVQLTFSLVQAHSHLIYPNLETYSQICQEVCLLYDCRSCQSDSINQLSLSLSSVL